MYLFFIFGCFASLHTYLNKLTGASIFCVPYFLPASFGVVYCFGVCVVALLAVIEELTLHLLPHGYGAGRKSIFLKPRPSPFASEAAPDSNNSVEEKGANSWSSSCTFLCRLLSVPDFLTALLRMRQPELPLQECRTVFLWQRRAWRNGGKSGLILGFRIRKSRQTGGVPVRRLKSILKKPFFPPEGFLRSYKKI